MLKTYFIRLPSDLTDILSAARQRGRLAFVMALRGGLDLARRSQCPDKWNSVRLYSGEKKTSRLRFCRADDCEIERLERQQGLPRYKIIAAAVHFARSDQAGNVIQMIAPIKKTDKNSGRRSD